MLFLLKFIIALILTSEPDSEWDPWLEYWGLQGGFGRASSNGSFARGQKSFLIQVPLSPHSIKCLNPCLNLTFSSSGLRGTTLSMSHSPPTVSAQCLPKVKSCSGSHLYPLLCFVTTMWHRSPRKASRKISKIPFKVLDAPELQDDFYLNLVKLLQFIQEWLAHDQWLWITQCVIHNLF